ncbi:FMN-binding negative transcriptional regulator (plasmid) [Pseudoalteromonas xiamenensis]|uniref:FMN-binding negative transcriptional regulator n=1 Tax=Pseudoalteromonas xiamenensis TaxID=882626 RepID=UPI0027E4764C|nr:FMN-binding negative transcriptional regulator [Pseudoalteromonas xiamenensis]WMN61826.1 FMN-binding negative transcriptional regulator [Pseudoalteromonas xiamenensis]
MKRYPKRQFIETNPNELVKVMLAFPLATIVDHHQNVVFVPLQPDELGTQLSGHVAAYNPLVNADGQDIVIVFSGEDDYISPNLVPNQYLPTWHYKKVIVKGTLNTIKDPRLAWHELVKQVEHVEQTESSPWKANSLSLEEQAMLMKQIQVFTIDIDSIEGHFKLSQHKSTEHQLAIRDALLAKKEQHAGTQKTTRDAEIIA